MTTVLIPITSSPASTTAGANTNLALINGATALAISCRNNMSLDIINDLIKHGANSNCRTSDGLTALHWACLNSNFNLAKTLAIAGVSYLILITRVRGTQCVRGTYLLVRFSFDVF